MGVDFFWGYLSQKESGHLSTLCCETSQIWRAKMQHDDGLTAPASALPGVPGHHTPGVLLAQTDGPLEAWPSLCSLHLPPCSASLQFVRSKAAEWHIDKERIGGSGGSAGGFTTLWLAFHPDMADAKSTDPIAHESTRLCCALTFVPQTSLDPQQMKAWIPNNDYGHHAFALASMAEFLTSASR